MKKSVKITENDTDIQYSCFNTKVCLVCKIKKNVSLEFYTKDINVCKICECLRKQKLRHKMGADPKLKWSGRSIR
jgi:hypothetical protein